MDMTLSGPVSLYEGNPMGDNMPSRTAIMIEVLTEQPGCSVEQLACAAYPEITTTTDAMRARMMRIRAVAILTKLVERGRLVRVVRGQYAIPPPVPVRRIVGE